MATLDGSRDAFDELGTVGVEEEFFVVDDRGRPTSGIDDLVYGDEPPAPLVGRIDHEPFRCTVETRTRVADGPADAAAAVGAARDALVEHAANHGYRIAAAGLHPAARWRELDRAWKGRYERQLDRIRYPQHRNTTAGVHVHVGVDGADRAVWVANELRWHLPPLLAAAANSPYWQGYDTGLASARAPVFETLPTTGIPGHFDDFDDYRRFERRLTEQGSLVDRGEVWYDVRPHPVHGTVEVRVPDAQTDRDRTAALVEHVHALVVGLAERHADGESGTRPRRAYLEESKWQAARYGHDATLLSRDGTTTLSLDEYVDRYGDGALAPLLDGSGAARQRRHRDAGGMDALCEALVLDPGE